MPQDKKYQVNLANSIWFLDDESFKVNEDKVFRKQLIDNIIKYSCDHMSLITAAVLIKKKFTTEEIIQNYYSNIDVFDNSWF